MQGMGWDGVEGHWVGTPRRNLDGRSEDGGPGAPTALAEARRKEAACCV